MDTTTHTQSTGNILKGETHLQQQQQNSDYVSAEQNALTQKYNHFERMEGGQYDSNQDTYRCK